MLMKIIIKNHAIRVKEGTGDPHSLTAQRRLAVASRHFLKL